MSLVTTCTACRTTFRVRVEQLAAHQAEVRCGHCHATFNALTLLREVTDPAPGPVPAAPAPVIADAETPFVFDPALVSEAPDLSQRPDHMAKTPADFGSRFTRILLAATLGLLLLAQAVYVLRNHLASHWTETRPALAAVCAMLNCRIELPRHADLLAIGDSSLQEDPAHPGVLRLATILVNQAPFAQDYPLLEITLTGLNDLPLLRRVLPPQEYLPAGTDPGAGLPANGKLPLNLALQPQDVKAAGYRIYLRYH